MFLFFSRGKSVTVRSDKRGRVTGYLSHPVMNRLASPVFVPKTCSSTRTHRDSCGFILRGTYRADLKEYQDQNSSKDDVSSSTPGTHFRIRFEALWFAHFSLTLRFTETMELLEHFFTSWTPAQSNSGICQSVCPSVRPSVTRSDGEIYDFRFTWLRT